MSLRLTILQGWVWTLLLVSTFPFSIALSCQLSREECPFAAPISGFLKFSIFFEIFIVGAFLPIFSPLSGANKIRAETG
jgi:hypothetical protein